MSSGLAGYSQLALVDGAFGIVCAPAGRLQVVLALTVSDARRITVIEVIADPGRLLRLRLALPPDQAGHGSYPAMRGGGREVTGPPRL
jgi:RNA polymerase sigma-70 factor (ECF subfamily)